MSATLTGLDGKTTRYKAQNVNVTGDAVTIPFRYSNDRLLPVTISGNTFSGYMTDLNGGILDGGLSVSDANVGGIVGRSPLNFSVHDFSFTSVTGFSVLDWLVPGPNGLFEYEPVSVNASTGKWTCRKPIAAKFIKYRTGMPPLKCCYVAEGVYYLNVDCDCSEDENLSSLKLNYNPKTGLFKGSFMIYAANGSVVGAGVKPTLKKYKANVMGVVVDGNGYGQAAVKNPSAGPWAVTVE